MNDHGREGLWVGAVLEKQRFEQSPWRKSKAPRNDRRTWNWWRLSPTSHWREEILRSKKAGNSCLRIAGLKFT
jgi:hypothetical protein